MDDVRGKTDSGAEASDGVLVISSSSESDDGDAGDANDDQHDDSDGAGAHGAESERSNAVANEQVACMRACVSVPLYD